MVDNACEGGTNHRMWLRVPGWSGFSPGQFVMLSPGAVGEAARTDPLLPRPMAVFRERAGAAGREIEILYKRGGRGTQLMAEARVGDAMAIVGPLGRGFETAGHVGRAILVAGGTGIASVFDLARRESSTRAVEVLLGARAAEDLMAVDDFAELDATLHLATEDGSRGERGRVTELLEKRLADGGDATVYSCGPTPMMERCAEIAVAHGARCYVSLENNMACGFGVCLGCAAPHRRGGYALVCREGPVFDGEDVVWSGLP